jgi:2-methylisocitrate lyase-like PEP mutase family enzyme
MTERQRPSLHPRLAIKKLLVAPGVFDGISARRSDGFKALYMTGYGTVASHLELADAGIATFSDIGRPRRRSRQRHEDAAHCRRRYRLWRVAQRSIFGAWL